MEIDTNKIVVNGIPIDSDTWTALEKAAQKDARSVEHIVNVALKEYVKTREL